MNNIKKLAINILTSRDKLYRDIRNKLKKDWNIEIHRIKIRNNNENYIYR